MIKAPYRGPRVMEVQVQVEHLPTGGMSQVSLSECVGVGGAALVTLFWF